MAESFSMELFNNIPSEQVSFYLELAEATGISSQEPEEVFFKYKSEGNEKWETLYTFKGDDVKSKIPGRFCCGLFEICSNKSLSDVKVIMTGSKTSPVVSDSLYPKQAESPKAKDVSTELFPKPAASPEAIDVSTPVLYPQQEESPKAEDVSSGLYP
ncbi:hypothetical protein DAPPUDRAFT_323972 [Daphnia pulex]|uniref:Uncharacterized protein n=1 Tax=Daphnia pulex TaxID=6669 RepID=E9H0C1_DAPPU|nr:hypothetical protein DAPPUDRAFT_323972 [Daphnia pulex]|eukprot:EFX74843.1 hypothetical protein DAPPUDRAFT_323972 [Daphnia pulex]